MFTLVGSRHERSFMLVIPLSLDKKYKHFKKWLAYPTVQCLGDEVPYADKINRDFACKLKVAYLKKSFRLLKNRYILYGKQFLTKGYNFFIFLIFKINEITDKLCLLKMTNLQSIRNLKRSKIFTTMIFVVISFGLSH